MGIFMWLKGYLAIWKQRVFIKDAISSTGELKAGVPQVLFLGHLLFFYFCKWRTFVADNMTGFGRLSWWHSHTCMVLLVICFF
jgi:hypothetical protein